MYITIHQLSCVTLNLLSPEKLKALYSFVDAASNVYSNKEVNEHDDASDIGRYFRPNDNNNNNTAVQYYVSTAVWVIWEVLE